MAAPDIDTILAALNDNADYAEVESVTKCRAYITACRRYLFAVPRNASRGADSTSMNPDLVLKEKEAAEAWLELHSADDGGPRVTRVDFGNFR